MSRSLAAILAVLIALPQAAGAHPHVFIDADLTLEYADGHLSGIAVEWRYDPLYSLLIIEDLGLDPDGDGELTEAENAAIQGFDSDWEDGFDGRLYLSADRQRIAMEDPRDFTARYEDGQLISRHLRVVTGDVTQEMPLKIEVYDPEYYVQFAIADQPRVEGAEGCDLRVIPGDPYAAADAYARAVEDALNEDETADAEMLVVDIGATGADQLRVNCGGGV